MVKCALACKFKYPTLPSSIHFLTGTERSSMAEMSQEYEHMDSSSSVLTAKEGVRTQLFDGNLSTTKQLLCVIPLFSFHSCSLLRLTHITLLGKYRKVNNC